MSTPLLLIATVVLWAFVEWRRIANHQPTISTDLTATEKAWPTFGMLAGLVLGLLFGHWFWTF